MFLFDDALESVVTVSGVGAAQRLLNKFRGGNHTVSYLHSRNSNCFATDSGFKLQIQFRFCHLRNIVERSLHGVVAAHLVRDSLVVTFYFFSLEYCRLSFSFSTVPFQNRSHFYYSFLVEILFGEFSVDCGRYFAAYRFLVLSE